MTVKRLFSVQTCARKKKYFPSRFIINLNRKLWVEFAFIFFIRRKKFTCSVCKYFSRHNLPLSDGIRFLRKSSPFVLHTDQLFNIANRFASRFFCSLNYVRGIDFSQKPQTLLLTFTKLMIRSSFLLATLIFLKLRIVRFVRFLK